MKINKLVLSCCLVLAACIAPLKADAATFRDVPADNSHYASIENLASKDILSGYSDGTFRPNNYVTRAQAAKIIAKSLNLTSNNTNRQQFRDVPKNSEYFDAIQALSERKIIGGYSSDNTFRPAEWLTRAQMAKILTRAFSLEQAQTITYPFRDIPNDSSFKYDIQSIYDEGVTNGTSATTFSPNKPVTRGQMASFVVRAHEGVRAPERTANGTYAEKVVALTNQARVENGLEPLAMSTSLMQSAQFKTEDMVATGILSHDSPNYGGMQNIFNRFNISYSYAGENIALGQRSPEEVVNAWMNSKGHRENILNSNYTHIGVGYSSNGNYWTQHFIRTR
ncbi:MAG: S-layer homology domain-containing protein [Lysinibacillus sp.]